MQSPEFHVSHRFKIVFVWISIFATCSLAAYQFDKRSKYWKLHVSNVMQPMTISPVHALEPGLATLFAGQLPNVKTQEAPFVLFHFWATWCAPCRAEIPTLNELQRRLGSSVKVVAIAADENKDDVVRFFANASPQFEVVWDQSQKVSQSWRVEKYPETFLFSRASNRMVRFSGPRDWSSPESMDYFAQVFGESS